MTVLDPSRLVIVLVEPQQPGNIGAVCRAIANFGAGELRLVTPCDRFHPEAVKFAVSAKPLLGQAQVYDDLDSALADLHFSVALTRRSGRLRGELDRLDQVPQRLLQLPADCRIGLVFGREDSGLTSQEVQSCSSAATIITPGDKGSMNLAQAVVVTLYEMSRHQAEAAPQASGTLPTQDQLASLLAQVEALVDHIGYTNPSRPEVVPATLRHLLARAVPRLEELNLLRGLVERLTQSVQGWPGRRRG